MGLALANYHGTHRDLSPALVNSGLFESHLFYSQGNRILNTPGWTMLLPYLDEVNAFERYDFSQCSTQSSPLAMPVAGTDLGNSEITDMFVSVFECPSHTAAGELSTHCTRYNRYLFPTECQTHEVSVCHRASNRLGCTVDAEFVRYSSWNVW